mmetsp:Transcript_114169/g.286869  ORF Transcript_114169/g.286869 Transcript_114169/m.286869 type:complete len:566 (+) Transcript_114169:116-1813(+)|eukprot:CAMPEP_0115523482 /NCGR_PEP_ID=MMETSP0271-20121206/80656_1 /TAXON_ID=71861 /ORGANISM="Scrippsiella trochoidea, Strain CCMP3099" /LENGTH=565 /DNA_ID=CAMNT_0002954889 /DNA_START=29 /DNA_END=1726 /DNA_ORIENTATION=+
MANIGIENRAAIFVVLFPLLIMLPAVTAGGYVKERSYMGPDFFSRFWFWKWPDLTHGHVDFADEATARAEGLLQASHDRVFISADRRSVTGGKPRRSVKIFSNDVYNSGLFVITLDHMPTGCGTWPAFWMTGGNSKEHWPSWGEYDIIEGVHLNTQVATALHTSKGCDQSSLVAGKDFGGTWQPAASKPSASDCYIKADGQWLNQGCSQIGPADSMGPSFNARGGGTYAAQWAPLDTGGGYFRTWFWPNGTEPADLIAGKPNPDAWGLPYSRYDLSPTSCPTSHFKNMRLVFDLTFCGDMAGVSYAEKCPAEAARMSCEELVSNHPEAFQDAYWSIRRLETYQWAAAPAVASPAAPAPGAANTCKTYGCHSTFDPSHGCQCDTECLSYGNCCDDAAALCGIHKEAAPDVFRSAFAGSSSSGQREVQKPTPPLAMCSAHPACAHLEKDCCPTREGMMLDCCKVDLHGSSETAFRKIVLKFMKRFQVISGGLPGSPSFLAHPLAAGLAMTVTASLLAVAVRTAAGRRKRQPHHGQAAGYAHMEVQDAQELLCADTSDVRDLHFITSL